MTEMSPDGGCELLVQDERAAGVISGTDPYKELELYLEKVNEEIGEEFERWVTDQNTKSGDVKTPPKPPIRTEKSRIITNSYMKSDDLNQKGSFLLKNEFEYIDNEEIDEENGAVNWGTKSLPGRTNRDSLIIPKRKKPNNNTRFYTFAAEKSRAIEREWSDSLLAEFNNFIARELTQLQIDAEKRRLAESYQEEEDEDDCVFYGMKNGTQARNEISASPTVSDSSGSSSNSSTGSLRKNPTIRKFERSLSDGPERATVQNVPSSPVSEDDVLFRRCSESDASPFKKLSSPEKIRKFFRSTSPFGKKNGQKRLYDIPPLPKKVVKEERNLPVTLQTILTKIRPKVVTPIKDDSPSSGFNTMESSYCDAEDLVDMILENVQVDIGTQTSPAVSRSSSFTWISDCSSSVVIHTPGSLSDSTSASSSSSSSSPARHEHCSDSDDCTSCSSSPTLSRGNQESVILEDTSLRSPTKCSRKETWEKIRRRNSDMFKAGRDVFIKPNEPQVWVRRENVETQTIEQDEVQIQVHDYDTTDRSSSLPPLPHEEVMVRSLPLPTEKLPQRPQVLDLTHGKKKVVVDLPSPASLKVPLSPLSPAELTSKASSAPLLKQSNGGRTDGEDSSTPNKSSQPRSQSERHLTEIEAAEACKWLRAAGFPQYAQMYEDLQFPIDVNGVQKDHPFLDQDSLQSLFRRLQALNRCVRMKVDNTAKNTADDSDEDEQCALSENWTFQPESRRWSRVSDVTFQQTDRLQSLGGNNQSSDEPLSGSERLTAQEDDILDQDEIPVIESYRYGSLPPGAISADSELLAVRFRRTGSERLRDSAKALLRRMESLKTRRKKKQNRENVVISGPQVLDVLTMQQRMKDLNCVDVSPTGTSGSSPEHHLMSGNVSPSCNFLSPPFADDSSSYCSDNSQGSSTPNVNQNKLTRNKRLLQQNDESGCLSDSEIQPSSWKHRYFKDANSNHAKVLEYIDGRSRGAKDQESTRSSPGTSKTYSRGGSLNLGKDSQRYRDKIQSGFRKKDVVVYRDRSASSGLTEDSSSTVTSQADSDQDCNEVTLRQRSAVVRWHSFQRGSSRPESYIRNVENSSPSCRSMNSLSTGQLLVLRKLALLKLTARMEKFCPTHRTGWNWELPKFIRKIKSPDYKDKTVFGVPLLLSLQRSGQSLPKSIQLALRWLRNNALDQVGLFRKSGVRSRIQTLKAMTESQGELINYDGQQAYDVADMVKQYFRELPEALLTNKLSETFIAIFQHVPVDFRTDAVQWVLLLLPDEHREALQTILEFLNKVSSKSACNQMTASNLAVCLAPSLFHLHHLSPGGQNRSASTSPRRRKTVGVPDHRELGESKAAHDCLLYLIKEQRDLFTISDEMLSQCHFNYMEDSVPVTLQELGTELQQDWRGYMYACTTALLKEARERSRGWISVAGSADPLTEIAYKKVRDGHPLKLWKVWTEVEAPPQELLNRVLRERHVWDLSLLKWRIVEKLDSQVEMFHYVCGNMSPLPPKDYCVLRSWRTDLPRGACVVVETSVEHQEAPVMMGGVRGVVLASRYLIEPCGSGKSRITHLSRVDTKGRSPDWYSKSYGHICAMQLSRIRTSFKHNADGPESKV